MKRKKRLSNFFKKMFVPKLSHSDIVSLIIALGQVDFPESPKTPEITEVTEDFSKVIKYLTKLKDTLINYV